MANYKYDTFECLCAKGFTGLKTCVKGKWNPEIFFYDSHISL